MSAPPEGSHSPHEVGSGRKRSRATLACARCKRMKVRCLPSTDGGRCLSCVSAGEATECIMPDPALDGRKRKRRAQTSVPPGMVGGGPLISTSPQQQPAFGFPAPVPQFAMPNGSENGSTSSFRPASGGNLDVWLAQHADPVVPPIQPAIQQTRTSHGGPELTIGYSRLFGATAINPGYESLSIVIRAPPSFSRSQSPTLEGETLAGPSHGPTFLQDLAQHASQLLPSYFQDQFPATTQQPIFEDDSDIPRADLLAELLPIFFARMGSMFPFLSLSSLRESINFERAEDPSLCLTAPLLVNCVCAIAARFSSNVSLQRKDRPPATRGVPFADTAKKLLMPLLGYPSFNTVAALLLLAHYEFGQNSESALWQFSGMALRMSVDMGLNHRVEEFQTGVSRAHLTASKLLFWSVVNLDRLLAIGTGRPVTLKDCDITTALPTDADIVLLAVDDPLDLSFTSPPSSYAHFTRLCVLYGKVAEMVNGAPESWKASRSTASQTRGEMDPLPSCGPVEDEFTAAYASLPSELVFSPANFRQEVRKGRAASFLHLHLWYNAMLILLYRPPLVYPNLNAAKLSLSDRLAIVNNSCLQISQILNCAETLDEFSILSVPFCNQCFFVAASAWLQDYRIRTGKNILSATAESNAGGTSGTSVSILARAALQNFSACKTALQHQAQYWGGVGWILALLEKHGKAQTRISLKDATQGVDTWVSSQEMAVFKRLVQRTIGKSPQAELNEETVAALFSILSQEDLSAAPLSFTPDDFALAYTFASSLPDGFS